MRFFTTQFLITLALTFCLLYPSTVSAHGGGEPFVKVNNEHPQNNPLATYAAYPDTFKTGLDTTSPSGYLVNEPLSFAVDEEALSETYYFDPKSETLREYRWEFGDGTRAAEGVSVTHAYSKPGTYIATLSFHTDSLGPEFQPIDTISLSIIPAKGYKLPKAKITVDSKLITNPDKEVIPAKSNTKITFAASSSTGKIKSYHWVLGDNTQVREKTFTHTYKEGYFLLYPMLRVTDENNITSDAFVILAFSQQSKKQSLFEKAITWLSHLFKK